MNVTKYLSLIVLYEDKILLLRKNTFRTQDVMNDLSHVPYPPEIYYDIPTMFFSEEEEIPDNSFNKVYSSELISDYIPKFLKHFFSFNGSKTSLKAQNQTFFHGSYRTTDWGTSKSFEYFYFSLMMDSSSDFALKSDNLIDYKIITVSEALKLYISNCIKIPPFTINILKAITLDTSCISKSINLRTVFELSSIERALSQPGLKLPIEIAFGIECLPVISDTAPPFTKTNITIIKEAEDCIIVDPGANHIGGELLKSFLKRNKRNVSVFLTHHHRDHIASIPIIESMYPEAKIYGHSYTLDRVTTKLKKVPVCSNNKDANIVLKKRVVKVISCPGHTKGHLALFCPISKVIIAGDHVVGVGSSLLDCNGGGCMIDYIASTEKLISLQPDIIIPCHGPVILKDTVQLLRNYIKHRLDREEKIKQVYDEGVTSLSDIVAKVYGEISKELKKYAKQNVKLHLRKLSKEGKIRDYKESKDFKA